MRNAAVDVTSSADADLLLPEGTGPPADIPAEMFTAAVAAYRACDRLDMQALARTLGLGRATLYRRTGNRERLLDEVVWWHSRIALAAAMDQTAHLRGVPRIAGLTGSILRSVEADRALHAFLEYDGEAALRILTGARSVVQQGMSAFLERLIDLETERGAFRADLDTPTLAFAIVRISEAFLYSDIIADRTPDIERAAAVVEGLLLGLDRTRQPG
ncbi:MAG: QsdR family transcriptional regulator [Marmoricola sp.]